jgi:MoxR-like ATPase
MKLQYEKQFDSSKPLPAPAAKKTEAIGDRRDGLVYLYSEELELAINIALATKRPLLLRGPSGSGKSSVARNLAIRLGRRYYERVITSTTVHTDLLYHYDALRRFRDSNQRDLPARPETDYIDPAALWWAFHRESAARRGVANGPAVLTDPSELQGEDAVVLIDEIDKADPDVPNNLLVTLGSYQFIVPYVSEAVATRNRPLLIITSNDERELPAAFLRRCVTFELPAPDETKLVEIAKLHFGTKRSSTKTYTEIARLLLANAAIPGQRKPGTAEYLDTVAACLELNVEPNTADPLWEQLTKITWHKQTQPGGDGQP